MAAGERRHIKYRAKLSSDQKEVVVKILEQTHRCRGFGNDDNNEIFRYEGIALDSYHSAGPEMSNSMYFFVWGQEGSDSNLLVMNLEAYVNFKKVVEAYNEHFSGGKSET